MARKHAKKYSKKQSVQRTLLTPEKVEKKIVTDPVTGDFKVVTIVTPAVYRQGKADAPTSTKGQRNTPKTGDKK